MTLGRLSDEVFRTSVDNTPIVSLYLIAGDHQTSGILLDFTCNRLSADYWFVPKGRIRKIETLADAFERLTLEKFGATCLLADASFIGVYQHFYPDFVYGEGQFTHCVVFAHVLTVNADCLSLSKGLHSDYRWYSEEELLDDKDVHPHTKEYFPVE